VVAKAIEPFHPIFQYTDVARGTNAAGNIPSIIFVS
jgi:hypothetical protein